MDIPFAWENGNAGQGSSQDMGLFENSLDMLEVTAALLADHAIRESYVRA